MKKALFILSVLVGSLSVNLFSQNIEINFAGDNDGVYVSLDSIYIKNLTQDADITLYAPDTSINLLIVGYSELSASQTSLLTLTQNFPNPFKDKTELNLNMVKDGILKVEVFTLLGQRVTHFQRIMNKGTHHFLFFPGGESVYLLSATAFGITKSIKMFCSADSKKDCKINYIRNTSANAYVKSEQWSKDFPFELGDELLFVGYNELGESGMIDSPGEQTTYTFQFATNIPCIGVPTVDYEGQIYNTIQIYSQCWFKENLNAGIMLPSSQSQTNNNTIEKYCMGDDESICDIMGGLYYWNEMMAYTNETGGQGICPEGWHVPDDMDWQILEGVVDSGFGVGDSEWNNYDWRGTDAGGNLKQIGTELWEPPNTGASDEFGFEAIPGGYFIQGGFWGPGFKAYFWSSENGYKFYRNMDWNQKMIQKNTGAGSPAFSVRCVKDPD